MELAQQLQAAMLEGDAFKDLQTAYQALKDEAETYELFTGFQELQMTLQREQMQGKQPSKEDLEKAQAMAEKMSQNETITNLMKQERELDKLLSEINNVVTKPITDLYRS